MVTQTRQRGFVLAVSLLILVVITLLAVSAINSSTVGLRIVGNMQSRSEAQDAAQLAIENTLNSQACFTAPGTCNPASPIALNGVNYTVQLLNLTCIRTEKDWPATYHPACDSSVLPCIRTYWDIEARARDTNSGAEVTLREGAKIIFSQVTFPDALCPDME